MKNYYILNILLIVATLGCFLGSVFATSPPSSVSQIVIKTKPVSKNCKWLGKVSEENVIRSMKTPGAHEEVEAEAFDALKNQAAKLGANTIVLKENTMSLKHWHSRHEHRIEDSHDFAGDAYRCPAR